MPTKRLEADVVILGAGFGGSVAASALSRQGLDVLLLDCERWVTDPLQAEKIEPDQAALLRDLGLLDERVPADPPIGVVLNCDGSGIQEFDTVEQYGISCHDTVFHLREVAARGSRVETASVRWRRVRGHGPPWIACGGGLGGPYAHLPDRSFQGSGRYRSPHGPCVQPLS